MNRKCSCDSIQDEPALNERPSSFPSTTDRVSPPTVRRPHSSRSRTASLLGGRNRGNNFDEDVTLIHPSLLQPTSSSPHSRRRTTSNSSSLNCGQPSNLPTKSSALSSHPNHQTQSKSWFHFSQLRHHHHDDEESETESIASMDLMCMGAKEFERIRKKKGDSKDEELEAISFENDGFETVEGNISIDSSKEGSQDLSTLDSDVLPFSVDDGHSKLVYGLEGLPLDSIFLKLCGEDETAKSLEDSSVPEVLEPHFLDFGFISNWRNCSLFTLQNRTQTHSARFCDSSTLQTPTLSNPDLNEVSPRSIDSDLVSNEGDVEEIYVSYDTERMGGNFRGGLERSRPSAPSSVVDNESESGFRMRSSGEEPKGPEDLDDIDDEMPGSSRSTRDLGLGLGLVFGKDEHHEGIQIVLSLASSTSNGTADTATTEETDGEIEEERIKISNLKLEEHSSREDFPFAVSSEQYEDVRTPTRREGRSPAITPKLSPSAFKSPAPFSTFKRSSSEGILRPGSSSPPFIYEKVLQAISMSASPSLSASPLFSSTASQHLEPATPTLDKKYASSSSSSYSLFSGTPRSRISTSSGSRTSVGSVASPVRISRKFSEEFGNIKLEEEILASDLISKEISWPGARTKSLEKVRRTQSFSGINNRVEVRKRSASLGSSDQTSTKFQLSSISETVSWIPGSGVTNEIRLVKDEFTPFAKSSSNHSLILVPATKEILELILSKPLPEILPSNVQARPSTAGSSSMRFIKAKRRLTSSSNFFLQSWNSEESTSNMTSNSTESPPEVGRLRKLRSRFFEKTSCQGLEDPLETGNPTVVEDPKHPKRLAKFKSRLGLR